MLKKSGSFVMARGVSLWTRRGFMLKEGGVSWWCKTDRSCSTSGLAVLTRAPCLMGMGGLHILGPALALLKAVQSLPVVPCPVRSDPAKRIVRNNGPLS